MDLSYEIPEPKYLIGDILLVELKERGGETGDIEKHISHMQIEIEDAQLHYEGDADWIYTALVLNDKGEYVPYVINEDEIVRVLFSKK